MRETISLSSMAQLLRHLANHVKGKKKAAAADEYGVPGMRGHGRPGGAGKTKTVKQPVTGRLHSPKIGGRAQGKKATNKFGVISKNVHASAAQLVDNISYALEGLPVDANFRKKHGVPPSGPGPHPPSSYKLPMPPASHPMAKKFARAVLSRAKKTKGVSPANVAKQVAKANRVLYGKSNPTAKDKSKHRESAGGRLLTMADLREYIPEKPAGSWERISSLVSKAAQDGDQFGGPVEYDYDKRDAKTPGPYDINVWASFPDKKAVIISNELTGKLWFANYAVSDDGVEFSNVKPVKLGIQAATESRRASLIASLRESGAPKELIETVAGVVVFGRCVEGMHIAGSAEDALGTIGPRVAKVKKHVNQLGKLVASQPCPCGDATHRPKLIASFPEAKTCVTDCEAGMHSVPYGTDKDGRFALGSPTKVKAKLVPVKTKESGRIRERAAAKPSGDELTFIGYIREARIDEAKKTAEADCVMLKEGPGNEVDGHYYTADLIKQTVDAGIFEGAQCYADHADDQEDRAGVRSIRHLVGWWSDVKLEEIEGKAAMCGIYHIETGNDFALNKMREAKNYAASNPDKPGYVGFSIAAAGVSEPQEIDGKTYSVVTRITEAISTDMVARAGAGGTMLNLKEVEKVKNAIKGLKLAPDAQKALAAVVAETLKQNAGARKKVLNESVKTAVRKFCEDAGFKLSDDQDKALDKALGLVDGGALDQAIDAATGVGSSDADPDDEEDEDDMGLGELGTGEDDDPDNAPDGSNDDETVEGGKANKKLITEVQVLKKRLAKAEAKEAVRLANETATSLAEEFKVPAAARAYFINQLLKVEGGEKAMREEAKALNEFFGATVATDVDGNPARRVAESGSKNLIVI